MASGAAPAIHGETAPAILRVVKLGGAAITDKAGLETLREEVLQTTARQLGDVCGREAPGGTVIVHGAGSFGHPQAAASGVARGGIEREAVRLGFAKTRASVTLLNNIVCKALLRGAPQRGAHQPLNCPESALPFRN